MTTQAGESEHSSTAAIITYIVLAQFTAAMIGVGVMAGMKITIASEMIGIIGTLVAAVNSLASGAVGYWMGSSSGNKTANAALAQLAGAGAPPPAAPLSTVPPMPAIDSPDWLEFAAWINAKPAPASGILPPVPDLWVEFQAEKKAKA